MLKYVRCGWVPTWAACDIRNVFEFSRYYSLGETQNYIRSGLKWKTQLLETTTKHSNVDWKFRIFHNMTILEGIRIWNKFLHQWPMFFNNNIHHYQQWSNLTIIIVCENELIDYSVFSFSYIDAVERIYAYG